MTAAEGEAAAERAVPTDAEARAIVLRSCPQTGVGVGPESLVAFVQHGTLSDDATAVLSLYVRSGVDLASFRAYARTFGPRGAQALWMPGA